MIDALVKLPNDSHFPVEIPWVLNQNVKDFPFFITGRVFSCICIMLPAISRPYHVSSMVKLLDICLLDLKSPNVEFDINMNGWEEAEGEEVGHNLIRWGMSLDRLMRSHYSETRGRLVVCI